MNQRTSKLRRRLEVLERRVGGDAAPLPAAPKPKVHVKVRAMASAQGLKLEPTAQVAPAGEAVVSGEGILIPWDRFLLPLPKPVFDAIDAAVLRRKLLVRA